MTTIRILMSIKLRFSWIPPNAIAHVTPGGYDARLPNVRLQVRVSAGSHQADWPNLYINVWRYGRLSLVRLQLKDDPFGTLR